MNFTLAPFDAVKTKADVLVLPLFDTDLTDKAKRPRELVAADKRLKGLLLASAAQEGFKAKVEQSLVLHTHGKLGAGKVILIGLGSRAKFEPEVLRLAAGRAVKLANKFRPKSAAFYLPITREFDACTKAAVEGLLLGSYRFDRYRTTNKEEKSASRVEKVVLILPEGHKRSKALDEAVAMGRRIAEATNWAKDLVNEPAAAVTPSRLADEAEALAKEFGLEAAVHGKNHIEKLSMGMFLAVARGSVEGPKLIELLYTPSDPEAAKRPQVALVGKAITFDSGGLSLKPADGMIDMKTDMAGAAAVLGAMRVIAKLKPPFPVRALMGACENMPSGNAYRPGDVLTSRLGKTVEITNTDAEGRLVLGDMLSYANEQHPAVIIDLATLTGACMVALGHHIAGAFGDDDQLVWAVLEAARRAGEEVWRMPVTDLQKDALRSDIADMKNSGERWGSAINAAIFLKEFVGETPWVHLDIAGPSQSPKERGYHGKGATGFGVRTLVEFVCRRTLETNQATSADAEDPKAA
jgi:leucyl aminopeptidase